MALAVILLSDARRASIPGPRWSNFVQQHLDNEYIAYVPLIVAFSLIAAFVVAGRPFLTRPYAVTTKVGAAESC